MGDTDGHRQGDARELDGTTRGRLPDRMWLYTALGVISLGKGLDSLRMSSNWRWWAAALFIGIGAVLLSEQALRFVRWRRSLTQRRSDR